MRLGCPSQDRVDLCGEALRCGFDAALLKELRNFPAGQLPLYDLQAELGSFGDALTEKAPLAHLHHVFRRHAIGHWRH